MTVKKRLAVSNVIMIIIPVIITLLIGCMCLGAVYFTLRSSNGFGFESSDDFYRTSNAVSGKMYEIFEHGSDDTKSRLSAIGNIIDNKTMFVKVYENGNDFYETGNEDIADTSLMASAQNIGNNAFVSNKTNQLYYYTGEENGNTYELYLFSVNTVTDNTAVKTVIISSIILIAAAIILSIGFTNRFLTRFVFKKIEAPLDMLSQGVNEISNGNLDYRLKYDGDDEFTPVCAAFNDMAKRLKDSVELTRKNEENRKELLLDISHDLRNPLTSINAYVEGLIDGVANTDEMRKKYLLTIKRKTEEIEKMVSSLFAYSKLDMESPDVKNEKTLLPEFLNATINSVYDEYKKRGLTVNILPNDNVKVICDRQLLTRITANLLDNSVKYGKKDGNMYISIKRNGNTAEIEFADDGNGVNDDELDRLFNVFYRTDTARTDTGSGNGIGLAFVKKAAEAMGGDVRAEKSEFGGLSIILELRCYDEQNTYNRR